MGNFSISWHVLPLEVIEVWNFIFILQDIYTSKPTKSTMLSTNMKEFLGYLIEQKNYGYLIGYLVIFYITFFSFDDISQKFFHIRNQHARFSRFWCIYVLKYEDEIPNFNDLQRQNVSWYRKISHWNNTQGHLLYRSRPLSRMAPLVGQRP